MVEVTDGHEQLTVAEKDVRFMESLGWTRVEEPAAPAAPKRTRTKK
ncbi:hypothetical protein [Tessaracoccus palaemonis]|uniref:Uncharacterized protein n=1 Tax=Tessaracoccus palaemonis TaxID=2829499 RepID=A0ABX8SHI1_9ACTN|nr:hypothetical protein [Tessaracoccus palaemonis]QXT62750.1 hypothetical protein KDB89_13605 [Tessaracoccus palaemonis]